MPREQQRAVGARGLLERAEAGRGPADPGRWEEYLPRQSLRVCSTEG